MVEIIAAILLGLVFGAGGVPCWWAVQRGRETWRGIAGAVFYGIGLPVVVRCATDGQWPATQSQVAFLVSFWLFEIVFVFLVWFMNRHSDLDGGTRTVR